MRLIMIYSLISFLSIAISSCAQNKYAVEQAILNDSSSCVKKNIAIIDAQIRESFGQEWLQKKIGKQSKIYLTLTLDSLGNVLKLDRYKADMMTKDQFDIFFSSLKEKHFCLFNGDPHLSFEQFIKYGKNRYQYTFVYPGNK